MKDVHVQLPEDIHDLLELERKATGIPVSLLVRKCVMEVYSGVDSLSADSTNRVDSTRRVGQETVREQTNA